ncbi:MAG: response regulator transcription factor [Alphaproteobacteria bacterium]|nr:response regulator transcription factor [Alphaproteobacteria bacterium]
MTTILLNINNADFMADLENQISRFVADAHFSEETPDVIIVDEDNLQKLRAEFPCVPIIYLTNNVNTTDDALNITVKKPFKLMRLLDIIRSANNRLDNSEEGVLCFGGFCLYPNKRMIKNSRSNETVKLTEKEVDIIKYLYKHCEEFVDKSDLQKNVWQYSNDVTTHTIETHIYRLRQKVETDEKHRLIETNGGKYRLKIDDNA